MRGLNLADLSILALVCLGIAPLSAQTSPAPTQAAPVVAPSAAATPLSKPDNAAAVAKAAPKADAVTDKAAQEKSKLAADALLERHTRDAQRAIRGICSGCMATAESDAPRTRRVYAARRPSLRMRRPPALYDGPDDTTQGPAVTSLVLATPARRMPVPAQISAFPSDR